MFSMEILKLHWICGDTDGPDDPCLHGRVRVRIGDDLVDSGETFWAVSAGALRMLESLFEDHVPGQEAHLLPCCGHFMLIDEDTGELLILGCSNGVDWGVFHDGGEVRLVTQGGTEARMPYQAYKAAVLRFAEAIEAFYAASTPKTPFGEDWQRRAYEAFWAKWRALKARAKGEEPAP